MSHLATHAAEAPPRSSSEWRAYAVAAAAFVLAAVPVWYFWREMRGSMPMNGGWEMSMAWMPMPPPDSLQSVFNGEAGAWTWSALMFAAMWVAMMVAMMLPSAMPVLMLYRRVLMFRKLPRASAKSALLAFGYFFSWLGFGLLAYGAGVALTQGAMRSDALSRAIPFLSAGGLMIAGIYQLTPLKQACLRHCRDPLLLVADHSRGTWREALWLGLHHGAFCVACCWALMLVQLVIGVMNLPLMAAVALVIALEKLLPHGDRLARVFGVLILATGVVSLARHLG